METVPEPGSKKNQLMTKLRKLLVVLGAALVVLGLLFAGLGRAHLPLERLRSIRRYASQLAKRQRQHLLIDPKVPRSERK
jgi:uncharacterized protein YhdP